MTTVGKTTSLQMTDYGTRDCVSRAAHEFQCDSDCLKDSRHEIAYCPVGSFTLCYARFNDLICMEADQCKTVSDQKLLPFN
jgi:hypothetical protein